MHVTSALETRGVCCGRWIRLGEGGEGVNGK